MTALEVRIDPAAPADVPVIHALIGALADYERLSHEVLASEADLERALFGPHPVAEAVVARAGGLSVGFALWFSTYSTFVGRAGLHLEDLFVLPEWRRRGIGRRLLGHVARVAVERGCGRLEWNVLDWNAPAIRIYEAAGARALHDWTTYRVTGPELRRLGDNS